LAASVCASCRDATAATKEESKPPDRSTPKGTSVISRFMTACKNMKQTMSRQPKSSQKSTQHWITLEFSSKAKQSKTFFQGLNIFSSESEVPNFIFQLASVCVCVCVCVFGWFFA
jgi:hypothetical protein